MNRICERMVMVLLAAMPVTFARAEVVETIDARRYEGRRCTFDDDTLKIQTSAGTRTLRRADVASVFFRSPVDILAVPGQAVVLTNHGDTLRANRLATKNDTLQICPDAGPPVSIPLSRIEAILLPPPRQMAREMIGLCEFARRSAGSRDLLVVEGKDGKARSVAGTFTSIDAGKIVFVYGKTPRVVRRERVRAIWFAPLASPPPPPKGKVETAEGGTYAFSTISLSEDRCSFLSPAGPRPILKRNDVGRITFFSRRVVLLAEQKPASVRQYGLLGEGIAYRVNRSAGGGSLRLGGREYDTGLGLHSFCELTYDLGGNYRMLIALAGIDDAVRPNGSATLTILADEKPILSPVLLSGRDAPLSLRLDVRGAARLTLRVEFGDDGTDVSDHVNLVEARLLK